MLGELLKEIGTALDTRQIPYIISGSLAMSAYTIRRMTRDIDIVIDLDFDNLESFLEVFSTDFYFHRHAIEEEVRRREMINVIDHRSGSRSIL